MAEPANSAVGTASVLWLAIAATPLLVLANHGLTPGTITISAVYFLGWLALTLGRRRRRECDAYSALWRHLPVRLATLLVLAVVQLVAVLGAGLALPLTLIATAALALSLWALTSSGPELAAAVARALLVVLGLGATAAVGELICRLDPVVARTGGSVVHRRSLGARHYDRLWTTNRHLLRSFHADRQKPDGVVRILALGDSFTWGDQIALTGDTWPYVMERHLRRAALPVEVLNLAEPGFTTVNSAERLALLGWTLEPDLVILQFGLNDPLPSRPGGRSVQESWLLPTWQLPPDMPAVRDHSFLWALLNDRFTSWQMRLRHPQGYAPMFDDDFPGWEACRTALSEMSTSARRRDVPMLVVLFPTFTDRLDDAGYPYLELHEKVRAAAEAAALPVLDLRPILAAAEPDGRSWRAAPWDAHPGIGAHALAGAAVTRELLVRGLLQAARQGGMH